MKPKHLCIMAVTTAIFCASLIVGEFVLNPSHPRLWLIAVNVAAISLNIWTFLTNYRRMQQKPDAMWREFHR